MSCGSGTCARPASAGRDRTAATPIYEQSKEVRGWLKEAGEVRSCRVYRLVKIHVQVEVEGRVLYSSLEGKGREGV